MRKLLLSTTVATSLLCSPLHIALENLYNLYYIHTSSLLNSTLGDLRDHRYSDSLWLAGSFSQLSSIYNSTLKVAQGEVGYDHAFVPPVGQNFLGVNFEYSYSWLDSPKNTTNVFGVAVYNTYLAPSRFYIDTRVKYLYLSPSYSTLSSSASHLFVGSLELGWKFVYSYGFFLQPTAKVSAGYGSEITLYDKTSTLHTPYSIPLFYQVGSYMGFELAKRADISLGIFYDGDQVFASSTLDNTTLKERANSRLTLSLQSNILATQNFRIYFGGKTSFFGESRLEYSANLGMRFLLGRDYAKVYKRPSTPQNPRTFASVQRNLLYEAQQSRRRVQERTHLKPQELEEQYTIQSNRNDKKVEDEIKYANRQRYLREKSLWKNIEVNEQNYANRTDGRIETRSINLIRDYNKREIERKYGVQQ